MAALSADAHAWKTDGGENVFLPHDGVVLAGEWRCKLNGRDAGTVRLPGTLDENGKGEPPRSQTETGRLTRLYEFVGVAEYSREVEVPAAWAGLRVRLTLERTKPSEVWIDGVRIGSSMTLSAPQRFECPPLAPGKHLLVIRVDNACGRVPVEAVHSHAYARATQTNWNGILGLIVLEPIASAEFDSVKIKASGSARKITIEFSVGGALPCSGASVSVSVRAEPLNFVGKAVVGGAILSATNRLCLAFGDDGKTWDEFEPNLYALTLSAPGVKTYETRVGLCDFAADGHRFAANGVPVFLRGKHDGCVFPLVAHSPMDTSTWRHYFSVAQDYGINHIRFHSWCPPEAAFAAADEVGVYLQPELPVWGTIAKTNEVLCASMREEGRRILAEYANHPSFVALELGNELFGENETMAEMVADLKKVDAVDGVARHVFSGGANNHLGKQGWFPWMDYFTTCRMTNEAWGCLSTHVRASFAFSDAEGGGWLNAARPNSAMNFDAAVGDCPIPVIGHETGQYQTYPDYDEKGKYAGVLRPYNFEVFRSRLQAAGLGSFAKRFHVDSGRWAVELYKADIEMNLRSGKMAGFQLLDLQDYPGQGTALVGVLDAFMESKGITTSEEWRMWCSESVPLAELSRFTFEDGDELKIAFKLCDYTRAGLAGHRFTWRLVRADGTTARSGTCFVREGGRGLKTLGEAAFNVHLTDARRPESVKLVLELSDVPCRNVYPLWIYPRCAGAACEPASSVTVAQRLDEEVERKLSAGGTVVWIPPPATVVAHSVGGMAQTDYWQWRMFKTVSENLKRPVSPGTLGLCLDASHPLFRGFPTASHASWQWAEIMKASRPLIVDGLDGRIDVPVRVIDNIERNHSLVTVFECAVGEGRLVACSVDFSKIGSYPEGRAFYLALMEYASSRIVVPLRRMDFGELKRFFASSAMAHATEKLDNVSNYK